MATFSRSSEEIHSPPVLITSAVSLRAPYTFASSVLACAPSFHQPISIHQKPTSIHRPLLTLAPIRNLHEPVRINRRDIPCQKPLAAVRAHVQHGRVVSLLFVVARRHPVATHGELAEALFWFWVGDRGGKGRERCVYSLCTRPRHADTYLLYDKHNIYTECTFPSHGTSSPVSIWINFRFTP